jgi:2-keto-3-deoxy-L-rhamnonate aldolase RhmA
LRRHAAEFFRSGFCQIASNASADFIIFNVEHGSFGIDVLKARMAFARGVGETLVVRVREIAYHFIVPILDAGAMGVI